MTPRNSPSHRQRSSDGLDVGLEIGGIVLKTLETAAKACPLPGLSSAASLALQITDAAKAVRANRGDFKRLATDVSQLVYVIIRTHQNISTEDQADSSLIANLNDVLTVLEGIEEFASKGATRSRFIAFWRSNLDASKIAEHREKLEQCLRKFSFESDISIRVMAAKLVAQHKKAMDSLENGESRDPSSNNVTKDRDRREAETKEAERPTPQVEKDVGAYRDPGNQDATASTTISVGTGTNFTNARAIVIGSDSKVNYRVGG